VLVRRLAGTTERLFGGQWTGIDWSPGALQRLGECMGLIMGVSLYDEPRAESLALDLVSCLDRLNTYGGVDDEGRRLYRVRLCSDGSLCGFSVYWNRLCTHTKCVDSDALRKEWAERKDNPDLRGLWIRRDWYTKKWRPLHNSERVVGVDNDVWADGYAMYVMAFNGGLLFHGFGHDPLAVQVGTARAWSLHT